MFILANFIFAVAKILSILLSIYKWLLLIRVLISWVNPDPFNPLVQFLYRSTEPVLEPIRRVLPFTGAIDFSPIIAFFLIVFLQTFLVQSLVDLAYQLR